MSLDQYFEYMNVHRVGFHDSFLRESVKKSQSIYILLHIMINLMLFND